MPEYWTSDDREQKGMVVPIFNARKIVASVVHGHAIHTNNGMSFIHQHDGFKVMVAASNERGGMYYKDSDLLELVDKNNFEKVSDKMVALLPDKNLPDFLEVLQRKHNVSITITQEQEKLLEQNQIRRSVKPIQLPPPEDPDQEEEYQLPAKDIIQLKVKLLALKLKLAA